MEVSPLRPRHEAAGALAAAPGEPIAVLTYGDVPAEYAAGRTGALLFDVSERGLVQLAGSDTEGFLHRILANLVKGLADDTGNSNLLLTGKGKVVHLFDLLRTNATLFELSTPAGDAPRLITSLDQYLFSEDTTLSDRTPSHAPLELVGPRAGDLVTEHLGLSLPAAPTAEGTLHTTRGEVRGVGAVRLTARPVAGHPGLRLEPLADDTAGACEALWALLVRSGAMPGGLVAWDSLRAERVVGAFGRDVTGDVYPQEARLESAFSLDKGCYIGQEVVAKIDTYGGLNKLLMLLRVDHDEPVAVGTRLVAREGDEARDLGVVTSWAYSFALDAGVVLGYVKRKHQDPGRVFELVPANGGEAAGRATVIAAE